MPGKVLFTAYKFPPTISPDALYCSAYVQFLPENGWEPVVLTSHKPDWDYTLRRRVNPNAKIPNHYVVCSPFTRILSGICRKFHVSYKFLGTPDCNWPWALLSWPICKNLVEKNKVDAVLTTSGPFSAALLGLKLKTKYNIRWVAELKDPWVGNLFVKYPSEAHRKLDLSMEKRVVTCADEIVVVSDGMKEMLLERYPSLDESSIHVIFNGFNPLDFKDLQYSKGEKFRIRYVGSMWAIDPKPLFKALLSLQKTNADFAERAILEIYGSYDKQHKISADKIGVSNVKWMGKYPHHKIPGILVGADILVPIMYDTTPHEYILGGKTGEYFAARRPIVAITKPSGIFYRVMKESGVADVCSPENISIISDSILNHFQLWKEGNIKFEPNIDLINKFDYKVSIVPQIARLLDG